LEQRGSLWFEVWVACVLIYYTSPGTQRRTIGPVSGLVLPFGVGGRGGYRRQYVYGLFAICMRSIVNLLKGVVEPDYNSIKIGQKGKLITLKCTLKEVFRVCNFIEKNTKFFD
jgi:hypothetical protein